MLLLAAAQRLAWCSAMLPPAAGERLVVSAASSLLSTDLVEETARWLPARAELCEAAAGWGDTAEAEAGRAAPGVEGEPVVEQSSDGGDNSTAAGVADLAGGRSAAGMNLAARFPECNELEVGRALRENGGHAGRAARALRELQR